MLQLSKKILKIPCANVLKNWTMVENGNKVEFCLAKIVSVYIPYFGPEKTAMIQQSILVNN